MEKSSFNSSSYNTKFNIKKQSVEITAFWETSL